jgi:hypothetical protein
VTSSGGLEIALFDPILLLSPCDDTEAAVKGEMKVGGGAVELVVVTNDDTVGVRVFGGSMSGSP